MMTSSPRRAHHGEEPAAPPPTRVLSRRRTAIAATVKSSKLKKRRGAIRGAPPGATHRGHPRGSSGRNGTSQREAARPEPAGSSQFGKGPAQHQRLPGDAAASPGPSSGESSEHAVQPSSRLETGRPGSTSIEGSPRRTGPPWSVEEMAEALNRRLIEIAEERSIGGNIGLRCHQRKQKASEDQDVDPPSSSACGEWPPGPPFSESE